MMYPKHQYIRSRQLMAAYRLIPCQICGAFDGTVCGAHSNQGRHGKGKGIKADDNQAASLCYRCHFAIDQGHSYSQSDRVTLWAQAQAKTVRELLARGLWPSAVPIPDIRKFDA